MHNVSIPITFALFSILAFVGSTSVKAQDEKTVRRVDFVDLDLLTKEGQHTLNNRIRQASHQVCVDAGYMPEQKSLEFAQCKRKALQSGQRQMQTIVNDLFVKKAAPKP